MATSIKSLEFKNTGKYSDELSVRWEAQINEHVTVSVAKCAYSKSWKASFSTACGYGVESFTCDFNASIFESKKQLVQELNGMQADTELMEELTEEAKSTAQRMAEHKATYNQPKEIVMTEETAQQVEDTATYTSTTYIQQGDALACSTSTLPSEVFAQLTAEQITEAIQDLMADSNIIKVEITQWTADSSNTIAFTLPGADSDQIRMTQPTIPEPPKPAHYGEEFGEQSGTGPVITVGHPHPHTGLIVQWPSDVHESYQEDCFINLLNSCPMQDIQPLMKQLDNLQEGDRIAFTWNKRDYKADFKLVKHRWHGGHINVKNATHTYGKTIKYQNNIQIQTMTNFRVIK